jgi:hypothetical protein
MNNQMVELEERVNNILRDEINPSLWRQGCSMEILSIYPEGTSYVILLTVDYSEDVSDEVYEHARELEWFLRDELSMPGLVVEIEDTD